MIIILQLPFSTGACTIRDFRTQTTHCRRCAPHVYPQTENGRCHRHCLRRRRLVDLLILLTIAFFRRGRAFSSVLSTTDARGGRGIDDRRQQHYQVLHT